MATRDFGGAVIPWYEPVIVGSVNFVHEKMPANPPADEVQKYLANQAYVRSKRSEGNSGFGGFLDRYVNPILDPMAADPLKTAAIFAATATGNAYLVPYIVGADTALAGGSPEDVLKSAAIAYVTQAAGSEIADATGGFTGATETGLPTLAGESVASDVGATLLNEASSPTYDFSPEIPIQNVSPEYDPTIFNPEPTPTYDFSPQVPVEEVSPEFDPTSYENTFEPAPKYDFSPETPVENVSPELDTTGTLADSLNPTLKDLAKTLRTANTVKNVVKALTPQEQQSQLLRNAQASQQQANMANMLRGTQMPQTMTPAIYKQANPFNFGQQNQPVQDTTALANLLRTA